MSKCKEISIPFNLSLLTWLQEDIKHELDLGDTRSPTHPVGDMYPGYLIAWKITRMGQGTPSWLHKETNPHYYRIDNHHLFAKNRH
jgi:hypothetical protein